MSDAAPIFAPGGGFPRFAFAGIEIPISRISVRGGIRHYNHEFPHAPGAEPEKMGRKLYVVRVSAHIHELPHSQAAEDFGDAYSKLSQLRRLWEAQTTADLLVPSIGTIQAFCTDWEQAADFERALSGEEIQLDFQEDQSSAFLTDTLFELGQNDLASRTSTGQVKWAHAFPAGTNPFDAINDVVSQIQAISGLADATNQLIAGKLAYIAQLCSSADASLKELQDPQNHEILDALKDVWSSANDLLFDATQRQQPIQLFNVPRRMSAGDVSAAIFGDTSHTLEILDLNPIEDAFAIPAGMTIRYRAAA